MLERIYGNGEARRGLAVLAHPADLAPLAAPDTAIRAAMETMAATAREDVERGCASMEELAHERLSREDRETIATMRADARRLAAVVTIPRRRSDGSIVMPDVVEAGAKW